MDKESDGLLGIVTVEKVVEASGCRYFVLILDLTVFWALFVFFFCFWPSICLYVVLLFNKNNLLPNQ